MKNFSLTFLFTVISFSAVAGLGGDGGTPVQFLDEGDGSGRAWGDMATARYSDNDVEHIGCGVRRILGGDPFEFGFCQATDAVGEDRLCITQDAGLMEIIGDSRTSYGFTVFRWDADGACTFIGFSTQSSNLPNLKDKKSKKDN